MNGWMRQPIGRMGRSESLRLLAAARAALVGPANAPPPRGMSGFVHGLRQAGRKLSAPLDAVLGPSKGAAGGDEGGGAPSSGVPIVMLGPTLSGPAYKLKL